MLDFLIFHPDLSRFYRLAKIGMNRGESWPESGMSDSGFSFACHEKATTTVDIKSKVISDQKYSRLNTNIVNGK